MILFSIELAINKKGLDNSILSKPFKLYILYTLNLY